MGCRAERTGTRARIGGGEDPCCLCHKRDARSSRPSTPRDTAPSEDLLDAAPLGPSLRLLERFEQPKEARRLADVAELNAECLHLDEQVLHVDDLVADQGLQEDTDQPHQSVLHVPILDILARGDAVGDVQVHKLRRQVDGRRQPVDHFHRVQADVHVHEYREVVGDL